MNTERVYFRNFKCALLVLGIAVFATAFARNAISAEIRQSPEEIMASGNDDDTVNLNYVEDVDPQNMPRVQRSSAVAQPFNLILMYSAEPYANVPSDFQPMTYQQAITVLQGRAESRCQRGARLIAKKDWADNVMTYGGQRYWITARFTCN